MDNATIIAAGSNASSARKKPRKIEGKKYTRIHARGTHGLIRRNAVTRVESLLFFSPPPSLHSYAANHNISSRVWLIAAISCEPSLLHVFPSPPPIFPCLNKPLDKRNWLKRKILDLEPSQSYYYSQSEWHKIALLFVLNVLSRDTVSRARRRYELFQNREFSWINRMVERVQKSSLVCATLSNLLSLFEKEKEIWDTFER